MTTDPNMTPIEGFNVRIVNGDYPRGLCLDGGVPAWSISAHGIRSVKAFLRQRMASAV